MKLTIVGYSRTAAYDQGGVYETSSSTGLLKVQGYDSQMELHTLDKICNSLLAPDTKTALRQLTELVAA